MNQEHLFAVVDDEEDFSGEKFNLTLRIPGYIGQLLGWRTWNWNDRLWLLLLDVRMGERCQIPHGSVLKESWNSLYPIISSLQDTENDTVTGFNIELWTLCLLCSGDTLGEECWDNLANCWKKGRQNNIEARSTWRKEGIWDATEIQLTRRFEIQHYVETKQEDTREKVWIGCEWRSICAGQNRGWTLHAFTRKLGSTGKCIVTRQGFGYCFENL